MPPCSVPSSTCQIPYGVWVSFMPMLSSMALLRDTDLVSHCSNQWLLTLLNVRMICCQFFPVENASPWTKGPMT